MSKTSLTPILRLALGAIASFSCAASMASEAGKVSKVVVRLKKCDAINKAIHSSALADGGTVKLLPGTYICHSPVVMDRDGIKLVGSGRGKTWIKAKAGYPMPVIVMGILKNNTLARKTEHWGVQYYPEREVKNITVSDLSVDSNMTEKTRPLECYNVDQPDLKKRGVKCDGDGGKFVRNNGISIRRVRDGKVLRVASIKAHSGGLVTEKLSRDLLVDDYYAAQNLYDGLAGYETENSVFRNMVIEKQLYSGISIDMGFEHNTFENVIVRDNNDRGVFSVQVQGNLFRNVQAINNGTVGFYFEGRHFYEKYFPQSCDGNVLENSASIGNGKAGVWFADPCKNTVLRNTVVKATSEKQACLVKALGPEDTTIINEGSDICTNEYKPE